MEKEMISFATLKKVLTPKELKNITGGSANCWLTCEWGSYDALCASNDPCECEEYGPPNGCTDINCGCM